MNERIIFTTLREKEELCKYRDTTNHRDGMGSGYPRVMVLLDRKLDLWKNATNLYVHVHRSYAAAARAAGEASPWRKMEQPYVCSPCPV